ncbi:Uncharacterized protein OBRU01_12635 [Operophtera brumata]|uniref:Uncharacterized protein n=1 Tax=Operophtera brumata TaxID=104452 RepID=A0A0L7L9N8_OPEBR|nr:Uncharacterized protein OBRU01_12635 [Operophtera brumata]
MRKLSDGPVASKLASLMPQLAFKLSGRYSVESPKGVTATVDSDALTLSVPGPGSYDLLVMDLCVHGEKQHVYIEEVLSVEVSTSRAVGVGACVPISALVKGVSHRYLSTSGAAEWRTSGDVTIIPSVARVPPGARLQLRHAGGPQPHLASLHYAPLTGLSLVTASGSVNGVSMGTARIKLVALDIENIELASAESYVEVIPISGLRVRSATQTLLVGSPSPVWIEAGGLSPSSLAALQPPPRVTFTLRDPAQARLYTTHADGTHLTISRLRVRSATQTLLVGSPSPVWIEAGGLSPSSLAALQPPPRVTFTLSDPAQARLYTTHADATQTLLVGSPSPVWIEAGGLSPSSLAAVQPPPRVTFTLRDPAQAILYTTHADDMLERSVAEGLSVRVVPLKPGVITIDVRVRNMGQVAETRSWDSTIEILGISDIRTAIEGQNVEMSSGDRIALVVGSTIRLKSLPRGSWKAYEDGAFELTPNGELKGQRPGHGVAVAHHKDERNNIYRETAIHVEVCVPHYCTAEPARDGGSAIRVCCLTATGGWGVCLEGVGWRAPAGVSIATGSGVSLAVLSRDTPGEHTLRQDRAGNSRTIQQLPIQKRYALDGVQVELPFICRTKTPHTAEPVINIMNDASEVELCAEWGVFRACTKALLLPPVHVSQSKVSVLSPPALFTVSGHPHALKLTKVVPSPGLKLDSATKPATLTKRHVSQSKVSVLRPPALFTVSGHPHALKLTKVVPSPGLKLDSATKPATLTKRHVSQSKVSVLRPPALFTVSGHPHALKLTKVVRSPGLKLDSASKPATLTKRHVSQSKVSVLSPPALFNGSGHPQSLKLSKLTNQEIRVEVERDCDVACGTLLGALISLIMPYMSTILTIAAVTAAYLYIQSRPQRKAQIRLPTEPVETVPGVVPQESNPLNRSRTWSRSPYASQGPSVPVYGDASVLPDNSFSPSSRTHSSTVTWSRSPYASQGPSVPVYGDASVLPDNSFSPSSRTHSRAQRAGVRRRQRAAGQQLLALEPDALEVPVALVLASTVTWSRSPYASQGPSVPVYGDASVLPDNSFSPSSRTHSRFL